MYIIGKAWDGMNGFSGMEWDGMKMSDVDWRCSKRGNKVKFIECKGMRCDGMR